ncbi:MAG: hypothetical protein HY928_01090 [Elusimicrobia bacterium]|nr:hypothetical protein [Elusimicrobiota bacterium]
MTHCMTLFAALCLAAAVPARAAAGEAGRFEALLAPLFTDMEGKPQVVSLDRAWLADDLPELVKVKVRGTFKKEGFSGFRTLAFLDARPRKVIYDSGAFQTGCGAADTRFGEHRLIAHSGKRLLVLELVDNKPGCVDTPTIHERRLQFFDASDGFNRVLELERMHADLGGSETPVKEEPMRLGWFEPSSGDEGDPVERLSYSQWRFIGGKRDPAGDKSGELVWDKDRARLELKPWK